MLRVQRISEHSFIEDGIRGATVLDLGLNYGAFSVGVIERYGCRVIGVEPVPELYERVRSIPGLDARQSAIGNGSVVDLHLNAGADAATTVAAMREQGADVVRVPTVTLDDLLTEVGDVGLVKVDIEGAEVEALMSVSPASLAKVEQLAVEFHDFADRAQAPGVRAVKRRLRNLGFVSINFSRDNTDVLFVNTARLPLTALERVWIVARYKYPRGIQRILRRRTTRG